MSYIFWNVINEQTFLNATQVASKTRSSQNCSILILIPIVCTFGIITNGLNISVFLHSKMKDISFKYMLAISASNVLYNFLLLYGYIIYCEDCDLNKSFGTQVFKIIVNNHLASCLAIFSNLIEIYLSLQRYFILKNKKTLQAISFKQVLLLLSLISLVYYIPALFCYDIVKKEIYSFNQTLANSTIYATELNVFSRSLFGKSLTISLLSLRIFLSSVLLSLINISNAVMFRHRFHTRAVLKLRNRSKSSNYSP